MPLGFLSTLTIIAARNILLKASSALWSLPRAAILLSATFLTGTYHLFRYTSGVKNIDNSISLGSPMQLRGGIVSRALNSKAAAIDTASRILITFDLFCELVGAGSKLKKEEWHTLRDLHTRQPIFIC